MTTILAESSAFQSRTNSPDQALIIKWLYQKLNRAGCECLRSRSRISVRSDEDDRGAATLSYQSSL